jgi:hypothetical protein
MLVFGIRPWMARTWIQDFAKGSLDSLLNVNHASPLREKFARRVPVDAPLSRDKDDRIVKETLVTISLSW